MCQLDTYENTSNIRINITNKGNKNRTKTDHYINKIKATKLPNLLVYIFI